MADDQETADEFGRAPKFHTDRSRYGDGLQTWLGHKFPERTGLQVTNIDIPVATGFSNETVLFDTSWTADGERHSKRLVARIEPSGGALFPVQSASCSVSVMLQHRAMTAVAARSDAPIPAIVGFENDPSVLGQPFFVMEFIAGQIPADHPRYSQAGFLVDDATPADRRRMIETGLEAMAQIHAIDWRDAGLDWLDASGSGRPTTQTQLDLYRTATTEWLKGREHPVLTAALDWLTVNDPHDNRVGLSWGDSRLANIIWDDYRPAAILDWEAAALCPTEADVGWWLMFDRMSFDDLDAPRLDGFPTRSEMIDIYEATSGRSVHDPHYWEVFATMRFCAIFVGLMDRMLGTDNDAAVDGPAIDNMVTDALVRLLDR